MMRMPDDYNVVYRPFPGDVYACVRIDSNGYPTVYINGFLSPEARKKALAHELHHFENGDFTSHVSIWDVEKGAIRAEQIAIMCRAERPLTVEEHGWLVLLGAHLYGLSKDATRLPLHECLANLRRMKHLNRNEVAWSIGVTAEEVAGYETGKIVPGADVLSRLSKLYGENLPS